MQSEQVLSEIAADVVFSLGHATLHVPLLLEHADDVTIAAAAVNPHTKCHPFIAASLHQDVRSSPQSHYVTLLYRVREIEFTGNSDRRYGGCAARETSGATLENRTRDLRFTKPLLYP
jgi:hypothetical protein